MGIRAVAALMMSTAVAAFGQASNAPLISGLQVHETLREQILHSLGNPNLALFLLVCGALLIYVEFNAPGMVVPGALGTVMVLVAVYELGQLPLRPTALMLVVAATALMLMEMKGLGHGLLALTGIVCLAVGTLTLVDSPNPALRIEPAVAIGLSVGLGVITATLLRVAMRARRGKFLIGPAALVGYSATAMEPIGPIAVQGEIGMGIGHILVQGEIWQATAAEPLAADTKLRVTGFEGDVLKVEAVREEALATSR